MNSPKIRRIHVELRLRPGFGFRGKRSYSLSLESNPSTGYSWTERDRLLPSIVEAKHHYTQHNGPPGTGGIDEWIFTAISLGEEVIKLAYASEFEPNNVDKWIEIYCKVV